jgi:hypothetical protein
MRCKGRIFDACLQFSRRSDYLARLDGKIRTILSRPSTSALENAKGGESIFDKWRGELGEIKSKQKGDWVV